MLACACPNCVSPSGVWRIKSIFANWLAAQLTNLLSIQPAEAEVPNCIVAARIVFPFAVTTSPNSIMLRYNPRLGSMNLN